MSIRTFINAEHKQNRQAHERHAREEAERERLANAGDGQGSPGEHLRPPGMPGFGPEWRDGRWIGGGQADKGGSGSGKSDCRKADGGIRSRYCRVTERLHGTI